MPLYSHVEQNAPVSFLYIHSLSLTCRPHMSTPSSHPHHLHLCCADESRRREVGRHGSTGEPEQGGVCATSFPTCLHSAAPWRCPLAWLTRGGRPRHITCRFRPCPTPFLACSARCPTLTCPIPMTHDSPTPAALQDGEGKETGRRCQTCSVVVWRSAGKAGGALAATAHVAGASRINFSLR
jgi:hypothetical protein